MDLAANLASVQKRIVAAAERAARDPGAVKLLAVTKGQPPEAVAAAVQSGLNLFGENKVQEARVKIPLCPGKIQWHFIGHLQSNKCRETVELFEMIQSVDSLPLAQEVARRAESASKTVPVLLEINVAGEASKFGYAPERLLDELPAFKTLRRVEIQGLMAVPPWSPDPEKARPHFRRLRELKTRCEQVLGTRLPHLSMGMSDDFEVAIEEGATIIRIGTALFGPRQAAKLRAAAD